MSTYFSKDFLDFFRELEKNNSKEWFDENRKRYEEQVKKPFQKFVKEMIERIGREEPLQIEPKDAIFRINKDVRFSKDKTPYNTHVSANISPQGKKSKEDPGFYFQFSHNNTLLVGGAYAVEKESLQKIREKLAAEGAHFQKLLADKDFREKFGELQGEKNKVLPKDLKEAAEKEPLIFNKQFYYMNELPADVVTKPGLAELLMDYYRAGKPVNFFLREAMKG